MVLELCHDPPTRRTREGTSFGGACGTVFPMTNPKRPGRKPPTPKLPGGRVPGPADVLAAAQAAVEAAQTAAGQALEAAQLTATSAFDTAVRLPPASAQLVAQLPGLIENLTAAIERLNSTIDRLDRTLALADPAFAAYDRLLPRLEGMISLGEDVLGRLAKVPGVALLGKLTGLSAPEPPAEEPVKRKPTRRRR
ncbi:hypothetical protein IFM12276_46500 [Nocardia sputorum]|uniref:Uncharacterized protein n=2 Tax=Nocardia sputorum TaxID=2984338 RepID=A0ABM8D2U7_9NOCA|nr:hypothetical protein IFM12276_46500 [Nocardia sputorum]